MKKVLLMLVIIFSIGVVNAKVIEAGKETTYYFSTSKNIVKEVMKDYYLRGDNIQYHESRGKYDSKPEEATSQDRQFQVCSVFYYNTLNTSFGMSRYNKNKIGIGPQIMADARKYYEKMQSNSKLKNGQYLIYYEKAYSTTDENGKITDPKKKYVYGFVDAKANDKGNYEDKTEVDANDFIKILQPGDIIFYKSRTNSGHYIVVYDFVKNSNGETDVLFLNSNGSTSIPSRLYGVKRLYYDYNTKNKGFFGAAVEGTVKYGYLMDVDGNSISKNIIKNKGDKKILSCGMEECTIVRPFFESDNKKTVFNYDIDTEAYLSSYLRTQYPGMVIEKTVDKVDNNSVYPEDTLTYTIKITK